jgi:cytochrome c-type biogenesis protein CcmH/NrfG
MPILKILLGLLALLLAWLYIYRTKLLFALNDFMRERVFSDKVVLFQGRRMAALLTLLGIVALFSGIEAVIDVQPIKPQIAAVMVAQARDDLGRGRYMKVVNRCRELVRSDPKNIEAWELLANAWWALGQKDRASRAVESILRLDASHPIKRTSVGEYALRDGNRKK